MSSVSAFEDMCDVVIIGAGPAGLSLSLSLRNLGLDVRLVERQSLTKLKAPDYDGREIALSLRSIDILKQLGVWDRIPVNAVSALKSAKVINGAAGAPLHFNPNAVGEDQLGAFVANSDIRKALFDEHTENGQASLITGANMRRIYPRASGGLVVLDDGRRLKTRLIVAADTRFSSARAMAGITASTHEFGKTMIVVKTRFERPHNHIAWECFLDGGALAILPLNDQYASVVQTFDHDKAHKQLQLDIKTYLDAASARISHRFGAIKPVSKRFSYPLVCVYSDRFVGPGFALVGDAAIGMHPMTAHGFNLGVQGQSILAKEIAKSLGNGRGPEDAQALTAYQKRHKRLSSTFYWSTVAMAELYSRESMPAKLARQALLDSGRFLSPIRNRIMHELTQPL